MSKPGKVLKRLCKKLGVRLTVKRGKKRVYKSIKVLKKQCSKKKLSRGSKYGKKKKQVKKKKNSFGSVAEMVPVNLRNIQLGSDYIIKKNDGQEISGKLMHYQGPNYHLNNDNNAQPGERPYIYVVSFDNRQGNTHHRIFVDKIVKIAEIDFLNLPKVLVKKIKGYY